MLDFSKPLYLLAPLAGYTDLPFRSVVKKFGADLTISEMISVNAILHQNEKSYKMMEKSPLETPYFVQIAGAQPDILAEAVKRLNGVEGIDGIDLNCGCPVPKVVCQGAGSSLLRDLDQLQSLLKTIKKYSAKRYTSAKIRIGFEEKRPVDIAKACEDAGIDLLSVHGRTRAGRFKSAVDYAAIRAIKEALTIPVIANGDIDSFEKAGEVLEVTGADGVMIGRGAIGKPWIFHQLKEGAQMVDADTKREVILEHFRQMVHFYGEYGTVLFRKHLHTYSKGYPQASEFRAKINRLSDAEAMASEISRFF